MSNPTDNTPAPQAPWYLREWLAACGKKQIHLQTELGWSKGKGNSIYNGHQRYNEELIAEVSTWLEIEPYELLMHPTVAASMRRLRQSAEAIVAERPARFSDDLAEVLPAAMKAKPR